MLICLSAAFVLTAAAQEKIDRDTVYHMAPVTTTATYATPRVSPVTFSDLTRLEIQRAYSTQDVPVLLSQMPSITFYSENGNGLGYNYINIRGFDQRRLSVMVNGIPQNDPEDHNVYWIDFPDLLGSTAALQVQRGAGSAFYGPPAIGGSVNIIAEPFQSKPFILIENSIGFQEYGSSNTVVLSTKKYNAAFNSGLIQNKYMLYGRIGTLQTDGYRDRSSNTVDSYFFGAERLDETMTTRIHIYGGPFSDALVYNGLPKFYNGDVNLRRANYSAFELNSTQDTVTSAGLRRPQETEKYSQPHFELLNEWRLSPKVTLNNTFFYIRGEGYYDFDGSWADTTMLRLGSAYGFPTTKNPANSMIRAYVGNTQWGWLPRLDIDHGTGTLTLGAEVRIHRSLHWGKISYAEDLPSGYDPDYHFYEYNGEKDIISLYGHEMYKLNDDLTLMIDLQGIYNRYGIANEKYLGNNFSYPYYFLNPRLGINDNVDEHFNVYATAAYTSREPRLKNLYAAEESYDGATPQFEADTTGGVVKYDFSKPLVKPEHLLDFELGTVYRDARFFASANIFWMEFSDELISNGQVDIFGEPVTGNAERTRHVGLELEGRVNMTNTLAVSGNATVSHNRLISYSVVETSSGGIVTHRSLDGNAIAGFPDFLGNLELSQIAEKWSATLDAKYVGSFYTDNTENDLLKNDAYVVLNASGLYTFDLGSGIQLTIRGEVRNILDRLYTMYGEGQEFFPAAERNYVLGVAVKL
jgi:iron complex outermembrane receptor protein